jgi:hypothetical protein
MDRGGQAPNPAKHIEQAEMILVGLARHFWPYQTRVFVRVPGLGAVSQVRPKAVASDRSRWPPAPAPPTAAPLHENLGARAPPSCACATCTPRRSSASSPSSREKKPLPSWPATTQSVVTTTWCYAPAGSNTRRPGYTARSRRNVTGECAPGTTPARL